MKFLKILFTTSVVLFTFSILNAHTVKAQTDEMKAEEIKIPDHCGLLAGIELSTDELKECLNIYRQAYLASHPEEMENQEDVAGYEPQMMKTNPRGYEPQMKPVGYEPQMRGNPKGYEPQMNKANSYYRY